MTILDFLKNKEEAEKAKKPTVKKTEKKSAKVSVEKKSENKVEKTSEAKTENTAKIADKKTKKAVDKFSYEAIKKPHISEKASYLAEKNQYVFEVLSNFNKTEIKKSIEGIYGVDVLSVNMVTIPPKKRRLGRTQGWRKEMTKAIIKIKEGQKIEIL